MTTALVTGINGFAGSYLAEHLLDEGRAVAGTILPKAPMDNIRHIEDRLQLLQCDITDSSRLREVVEKSAPDEIYHLAAISFVPRSITHPRETWETNLFGTLNLYDAVQGIGIEPRILFVGTGEEYGRVEQDKLPVDENCELKPPTPYAASKAAADLASLQYAGQGMHVVRVRPFNHTGPRQAPTFVCSDFAKMVAEGKRDESRRSLAVGNLDAERDFCDVRDMVRAYRLALEKGCSGEVYNICSGKARRVGDILDALVKMSGVDFAIGTDPKKMRPLDTPTIVGNCDKFTNLTGWKSGIPFEETLNDLLDYWERNI